MNRKPNYALAEAILGMGPLGAAKPQEPKNDSKLVMLRQLHSLSRDSLRAAQNAVYSAQLAKWEAEKHFAETKVLIEVHKDTLSMCRSFACYAVVERAGLYCEECERVGSRED